MNILKTILQIVAPMAFLRLYGAGGGDGGAPDMRAQEQQRQKQVQQAVDAINVRFGVNPQGSAPSRDLFVKTRQVVTQDPDTGANVTQTERYFDEAGYNAALAGFQNQSNTEATANKTAREGQYTEIADAVRQMAMRDLDRQYSQASQRNTFGLARNGLQGGSVDAEAGGELAELYGEGKLKATQAGQQSASDLRSTDEKTRQNLISLAQSGLDTGTAASMAAGQMSAAADLARSQAAGASVGRLFDDMTQAYMNNQYMKARYPSGAPQQQPSGYGTSVFSPTKYTGNVQR